MSGTGTMPGRLASVAGTQVDDAGPSWEARERSVEVLGTWRTRSHATAGAATV